MGRHVYDCLHQRGAIASRVDGHEQSVEHEDRKMRNSILLVVKAIQLGNA
jgi:hypothetical protein